MKGSTLFLWVVVFACCLLVLRLQTKRPPASVKEKEPSPPSKVSSVKTPPGIIRASTATHPFARRPVRKEAGSARMSNTAANRPSSKPGIDVIPNEFVLSFRSEADRAAFIEKAKAHGVEIIGMLGLGNTVLVKVKKPEDLQQALSESPSPVRSSPNYYFLAPEIPGKETMKPQGNYIAFGDQALKWLGVKGDNSSWGRDVVVAVLDNGVGSHPALREGNIIREDLVNEDAPASGDNTHSGHANAVASIIAGASDDVHGIAPAAAILSIKVINSDGVGDSFTVAEGIVEAADRGAKVINVCIGSYGDCFLLKQAVDYARQNGCVIVAAVGNEAVEGVSYPAKYDGVIGVSAVDAAGRHMYFANRGNEVSVSAPGVGVKSAWSGNDFVGFSGTSAAVPFVSGAIAYLLSENPDMTAGEAAALLIKYADDAGAPGKDKEYGSGILDVQRVAERNQKGIYDIAASGVCYKPASSANDQNLVLMSAQNRGTENLPAVEMKAEIAGRTWTTNFQNVAAGQTVSVEVPIDAWKPGEKKVLPVSFSAAVSGATDRNPTNNVQRGVFFLEDGSK